MKYLFLIPALFISVAGYSQPEQKFIRKGNHEYNDKKYGEAEVNYRKALEKKSTSRKAEYNLSNSLYKQEKYEAAATKYQGLTAQENDRNELSRYYYNQGNSLLKANKLNESIEAYKNALRNNPSDEDAKHNLQVALRLKNSQQQQQQDNKDQQDNKNSQDKQDQQNQQDQQQQSQQQQAQQQQGQISKEDAERLLQALENDEKEVLQKVREKQSQVKRVPVEKDW